MVASQPLDQSIWIYDPDPISRHQLSNFIQQLGYISLAISSQAELQILLEHVVAPSLVLIHLSRLDQEAIGTCRQLARRRNFPVVALLPTEEVDEGISELFGHIDDFILQPIERNHLLLRLRFVLQRAVQRVSALDLWMPLDETVSVNFARRLVAIETGEVALTEIEGLLLQCLFDHRGYAVPAEQLVQAALTTDKQSEETLRVHISRLRHKIEPNPQQVRFILTVRGIGYYMPERPSTAADEWRKPDASASPPPVASFALPALSSVQVLAAPSLAAS